MGLILARNSWAQPVCHRHGHPYRRPSRGEGAGRPEKDGSSRRPDHRAPRRGREGDADGPCHHRKADRPRCGPADRADRPGRRRHRRSDRFCRFDLHAGNPGDPDPDDPPRPGGQQHRGEDGGGHRRREEPARDLPPAEGGLHRPRLPADAPRRAVPQRPCRGDQIRGHRSPRNSWTTIEAAAAAGGLRESAFLETDHHDRLPDQEGDCGARRMGPGTPADPELRPYRRPRRRSGIRLLPFPRRSRGDRHGRGGDPLGELHYLPADDRQRIASVIRAVGLPDRIPAETWIWKRSSPGLRGTRKRRGRRSILSCSRSWDSHS